MLHLTNQQQILAFTMQLPTPTVVNASFHQFALYRQNGLRFFHLERSYYIKTLISPFILKVKVQKLWL